MTLLSVAGVNFGYGAIRAIDHVSLAVETGEIVAILGANGAGKSTLLKGIAGVIPLREGAIGFNGTDISRTPAHRRVVSGIALSPEGRQIFADQSVRDNLVLGAYSRRLSSTELRDEIGRQFALFPRLEERQRQIAGTLSGGEQQMLAIARALMAKPTLLMLDEPSLGLAPLVTLEIFSAIRNLRNTGLTILLVEQMANQALAIADRAYVLETGKITVEGTGHELLDDPRIRAAYLGAA